jgi:hypothetical protein
MNNLSNECTSCSSKFFVGPLHGAKGGPWMCAKCRVEWDARDRRDRKGKPDYIRAVHGDDGDYASVDDNYKFLTLELLEDAIALTHPDRHPAERQELARRVTTELLALKPYTLPKPPPSKPPAPVTAPAIQEPDKLLRISFPCKQCYATVPLYYCDKCRAEWEKREHDEAERERAQHRRW